MDTKQLVAFCAVVERRSFSQAADQLGVTQPAVSLQIRSLEQRIGQQLLDRSGRQVGRRELELGVVGVASRQRGVSFEPLYRDEVVLAVPAGHKRAGKSMTLEELKAEPLVLMQEGAGIRQIIDDELRELGVRLRDLNVKLELGLQESARAAVLGGFGATFISRIAIEGDLAAGTLAIARVEGLEPARDVQLARASGRAETRVAQEFVTFARERLNSSDSS